LSNRATEAIGAIRDGGGESTVVRGLRERIEALVNLRDLPRSSEETKPTSQTPATGPAN
jgi:hypothetical protein